MRIVVSSFVTLDGVMEAPNLWWFDYRSDEGAKFKLDELFASDGLLLGRVTYEGFAAAWPGQSDEAGYADRINAFPKHVVSTTLTNPTWTNTQVIDGDVAKRVAELRRQPGADLLIFGSADLINSLMPHGLIDEYRLMVFPLVRGAGKRLFADGSEAKLSLVETKPLANGVTVLRYHPA